MQDPLDYLRVGIDPSAEGRQVVEGLQTEGFRVGRRIETPRYVAFDASRGPETTVRVLTGRGPAFSLQTPDARVPNRAAVSLWTAEGPDFDRDGMGDVVVAVREVDRTCLAWLEVDAAGFVSAVFLPKSEWGEDPCVLDIDRFWPRLLLEVAVPDRPGLDARVRVPVHFVFGHWALDDSPSATARWDREVARRKETLERAVQAGDTVTADRLRAELSWLEYLQAPPESAGDSVPRGEPVLEPAEDGEEAR